MKYLLFFIIGFALAVKVLFLCHLPYFKRLRKKRQEELTAYPASKCGIFCGYYGSTDDYIKQPEEKEVTDSGSNTDA